MKLSVTDELTDLRTHTRIVSFIVLDFMNYYIHSALGNVNNDAETYTTFFSKLTDLLYKIYVKK